MRTVSHNLRRLVAALLGIALLAQVLLAITATAASPVPAAAVAPSAAPPTPTVSPQPQHLAANGERQFALSDKRVRIVVDDTVDEPTRDLVRRIFDGAGADRIEVVTSSEPTAGRAPVTVRVGSVDTPDIAEALADAGAEVPADLRAEGYALATTGNPMATVVLAGVDAAGTFYAAQTLRQLVYPKDDAFWLPGVEVVDWPSMPLRGTIEGFYGAPWTQQDRLDQMRFYGDVKLNTYIYAPKDDPYHRERWRDPYPADKLAELAELVDEAAANHVRFTFALSPGFHQPPNATKICFTGESDWNALIAKLQAMYDVGVRAFNLPFDDISLNRWSCPSDQETYGSPNSQANQARAQADLLNRLQAEFVETHPGTFPLQMVPTHYEGIADTSYRQSLRANLDAGIEVMWTGMATVPPDIRVADAEAAATVFGRKVFVWDNYPVNDFGTPGRLHLAPYQKREPGLSAAVTGIVANPMNQAGASKVALFTVADFLWNEHGYDHQRSWQQAARYLSNGKPKTVDALLTFFDLNHLAPTFGADPWLPQAPALAAEIGQFWQHWDAGQKRAAIDGLRPYAAATAAAPEAIRKGVTDPIFAADVERWLAATDLWGQASLVSLDAAQAQLAGDEDRADELFGEARDLMEQASLIPTDPRPRPQGTIRLADGVLDVFLTNLHDPCTREDPPADLNCPVNVAVGKAATQRSTAYGGVAERAVDGNTDGNWSAGSVTHSAEDGSPEPWWQVDLGASVPIHSVHVWNRSDCCSERLGDYYVLVSNEPFGSGSLADVRAQPGVTALHEPSTAGRPTSIFTDDLDLTGRYVRVQLTGNAPLSIAEVQVLAFTE